MAQTPVSPSTADEGPCARRALTRRAFAGFSAAVLAGLAAVPARAEASSLRDLGSYVQELLKSSGESASAPAAQPAAVPAGRPSLLQSISGKSYEPVAAAVTPYTVADDFSNVINMDSFYFNDLQLDRLRGNGFLVMRETGREFFEVYEQNRYSLVPNFVTVDSMTHTYDLQLDRLRGNGFLVMRETGREFFEVYEQNRYSLVPNFVTVDSMTHTYHLYFAFLLRTTERDYLAQMMRNLTGLLLRASEAQLEVLRGSDWEAAARRNVGFLSVASQLMGTGDPVPGDVQAEVQAEVDLVRGAGGLAVSPLFGGDEDYSQYAPRGSGRGRPGAGGRRPRRVSTFWRRRGLQPVCAARLLRGQPRP